MSDSIIKKHMKIYGAPEKLEWVLKLNNGKLCTEVHFEGGSISGYGAQPARYKTEHPLVQQLIEGSPYFKAGEIILMHDYGAEPVKEEAPKLESKEFYDWENAKDWLCGELGASRNKVRTQAQAEAFAQSKGYQIVITGK